MAKKKKSVASYLAIWPRIASWVLGNIRFVLFLVFLTVVYISFVRQAEANVLKIKRLEDEVKKIRREYMSLQSEVMYESTHSHVTESMVKKGFVVDLKGPERIIVSKKEVQLKE